MWLKQVVKQDYKGSNLVVFIQVFGATLEGQGYLRYPYTAAYYGTDPIGEYF